jgi:hypothetical protein
VPVACFIELAFQKLSPMALDAFSSFCCSNSLVKMMYQEPMLMMIMMISVPLATKSPCFHSASRP